MFILSCESTVDLPYRYVRERNIPVLFYTWSAQGVEHPDDMGRDPQALSRFYELLSKGVLPSTSQLNQQQYLEFFDDLLRQGDVLHIAFGTGMTGSYNNADAAAREIRGKYPGRKLIVIDSLCSSSGYGLLTDCAADLRDEGRSIEETAAWVMENRHRVHHQFYSTDLSFYRRSGRISIGAAIMGTMLGICPIMRLDDRGRIIAYSKTRGRKHALAETLRAMEAHAVGGTSYSGKCFVCHSNCPREAEDAKAALKARFPNIRGDIRICDIGTIIASHCGPGTVAVFFFGDERAPE